MSEQYIWDYLSKKIDNPYGVAAIMGNLFAESSLNPLCKTGGNDEVIRTINGETYTTLVNDGVITPYDFSHDGVAYGLAQWRYWSRKEQLFLFARESKQDIGNLDIHLAFLLKEMPSYTTVCKLVTTGTDIREISDSIMERYEKPGNVSDKAKEKRALFAKTYYNTYALKDIPSKGPMVVTTADRVNIRAGNGKNYPIVTQISKRGTAFPLIAEASNGWYAVDISAKKIRSVGWISADYSKKEV